MLKREREREREIAREGGKQRERERGSSSHGSSHWPAVLWLLLLETFSPPNLPYNTYFMSKFHACHLYSVDAYK
jgi:hypothetical protein